MKSNPFFLFIIIAISSILVSSCQKKKGKVEQLTFSEFESSDGFDSIKYSITKNSTFQKLNSSFNSVVITGMHDVRLLTFYKIKPKTDRNINFNYSSSYEYEYYQDEIGKYRYFIPGMDIINGYNLINIGHYNIENEKLSYFFNKPVLIKTLYFPGEKPDSLGGIEVKRDFFFVSVYDDDTNNDSLINNKDLRRFYHIDKFNTHKTKLLPDNYSAVRSTYDYQNDIFYIYARHDSNKNGRPESFENMAIFWLKLTEPTILKRMI